MFANIFQYLFEKFKTNYRTEIKLVVESNENSRKRRKIQLKWGCTWENFFQCSARKFWKALKSFCVFRRLQVSTHFILHESDKFWLNTDNLSEKGKVPMKLIYILHGLSGMMLIKIVNEIFCRRSRHFVDKSATSPKKLKMGWWDMNCDS